MQGFVKFCSSLGCSEKTFRADKKSEGFYRISYSGEDARKIAEYLYKDCSYFLERKRKVALENFVEFGKKVESKKKPEDMKYIHDRGSYFTLQVNGKYIGCYKTADEAKQKREEYLKGEVC